MIRLVLAVIGRTSPEELARFTGDYDLKDRH
jgi:hypothetical protein